ncbi:hypothetical protein [Microbulbifer taiwanensis]|uniref:Sulfotransferase domain-containing protein n=1 Tax=Microbulbifer taiwanensis TaxID=986746 RepID=A0ABW1YIR2_9GAMM|nr:hypothetical protein [Microbulbifer taiwanensis]
MRTLFLHIGFHKTGSSSLQLALKSHSDRLLEKGFEFVSLGKKGNSSSSIKVSKRDGRLAFRISPRYEQLLAASREERVIVSGEHFAFLHSATDIEQLRTLCGKYFDETVIVAYLRRQDRQAMSFKQQAARACERDWSSSSKLMGHSDGAFPALSEDVKTYYDYFAKLQLWERYFGRHALRVREFEPGSLDGSDIVTDFAHLLGGSVEIPPCRINESICRKQFLLTHKLIDLGVARREIEKLRPLMATDSARLMPSRSSALAFFLQFEDSNRQLNDRYLPRESGLAFSDDFSVYPDEGNDRISVSDLVRWAPDLFTAGLTGPAGLRDALLVDRLEALLAEQSEGGEDNSLLGELGALRQCLLRTATTVPQRRPWYRRLGIGKSSGR